VGTVGHNKGEYSKDRCERDCHRFHPHRHWELRHRNVSACFESNLREDRSHD
jgi:hypothetical protein